MVVGSSLRLLKYFLIGLVSGLTRNLSPTNLSDLPYEGFFQTAFKKIIIIIMANTPFTKLVFSSVLFMSKVEIWC